jgi:hypothetical protein
MPIYPFIPDEQLFETKYNTARLQYACRQLSAGQLL